MDHEDAFSPVDTESGFARAIREHLELKSRNSELDTEMPIDRYLDGDPLDNHPLFKSEEQARIEETLEGEPAADLSSDSLPWPGEDTVESVEGAALDEADHLLHEAAPELQAAHQPPAQRRRADEVAVHVGAHQLTLGVDGVGALLCAEAADGVELFEAEADGVNHPVASGAAGVAPVCLVFRPRGQLGTAGRGLRQHLGRWRRNLLA